MMKNLGKVFGIALYVMAGFMLLYAIWALIHNIGYISDLINSGQLRFAGNEYDIISFYMTNCGQYALYTIILFALGWMIARNPAVVIPENEQSLDIKTESGADDVDDWFGEQN